MKFRVWSVVAETTQKEEIFESAEDRDVWASALALQLNLEEFDQYWTVFTADCEHKYDIEATRTHFADGGCAGVAHFGVRPGRVDHLVSQWLWARYLSVGANGTIGTRASLCSCPLARSLSSIFGCHVIVDGFTVTAFHNGTAAVLEYCNLPIGFRYFVELIDEMQGCEAEVALVSNRVTARQAILCMAQARKRARDAYDRNQTPCEGTFYATA